MKLLNCRVCVLQVVVLMQALIFAGLLRAAATPASSVVILLSSPNPVVQGQGEVFTAGVNVASDSYATGTITISDSCAGVVSPSIAVLGTISLGSATSATPAGGSLTITTFPCLGQNTITAQYSGDANYLPGTSAPLIETVLSQFTPASIALSSSSNPEVEGQSVTFTAVLTYVFTENSHPTGSVTLTDTSTGTVLGSATVQTAGGARQLTTSASFSTAALAAGSYAIQASYSGDNIYAPGTSQLVNQVVQPSAVDPTATNLSASATTITAGTAVTLSAQVSSPDGTPGGTLNFLDGTTSLAMVNVDANGQASLSTSALAAGVHALTAAYGGSPQFSASASAILDVTVQAASLTATSTALAASANPAASGNAIVLSATVTSSGTGTPTGSVTFQDGSVTPPNVLGTATMQNGVASITSTLAAGSYPLTATYSGDNTFASSTGTLSEVVTASNVPATLTTITSSANPTTYGQSVTFTATVTNGTGTPPTGAVTFNVGSASASVNVDSTGTAVFTTSSVPVGTANVSAAYSGDGANGASISPVLGQTVTQAATEIAVVSSLNPSHTSDTVSFTATVSAIAPGSGVPTGTISFLADGTMLLCDSLAVQADGTAACSNGTLATGAHVITANYSGDTNFTASTDSSLTQTVSNAETPSADNVQLNLTGTGFIYNPVSDVFSAMLTLTNSGAAAVPGSIQVIFNGLPDGVTLHNASGIVAGAPFVMVPMTLAAGQSTSFPVRFQNPNLVDISYAVAFNTGVPNAKAAAVRVRKSHHPHHPGADR